MAKKSAAPDLPIDGEPGSYEWAEELVQFMNAAWRTKEMAEGDFLKAAAAAVAYRIWEVLSPPFPEEPYASLEGLIRHTADPGQAENMQIAIRLNNILDQAVARRRGEDEAREAAGRAAVAASGSAGGEARAVVPGKAGGTGFATGGPEEGHASPLTEEEELALGSALLDQYAAQLAARGTGPAGLGLAGAGPSGVDAQAAAAAGRMVAAGETVRLPAGPGSSESAGGGAGRATAGGERRSAAQRKRDRLERTHPELAEAVDAGEMTLKQAYVQAGIEKEIRTLDKLQRLWRDASEEERDRFLTWLEEQEGAERRREYEEEVYGEE